MLPQIVCCSARHIARMPSASRGRIGGIGPSGATAGVGVLAPGAAEDGAADAEPAPPPPIAATALRQDADSFAALLCRHCSAAEPPGCTPEQFAMKSDRQAARMAAFWASLGGDGDAALGAATAAASLEAAGSREIVDFLLGFAAVVLLSDLRSGASAARGGSACSAAWQCGDKSDAFDCRQRRSSGLLGLIQEQCAMKSLSVQDCRTVFGVPTPDMRIDLPMIEFFGRGGALKPSWYGDCLPSGDFPMLVDLYLGGRLDLDRFVSETIGIDQVEAAFARMQRGEVLRSVVVL